MATRLVSVATKCGRVGTSDNTNCSFFFNLDKNSCDSEPKILKILFDNKNKIEMHLSGSDTLICTEMFTYLKLLSILQDHRFTQN